MEQYPKIEFNNIGTTSQPDIQSNSSLCLSVSDLKQKIEGIEEQLNTVSKHCQNLAALEYNLRPVAINSETSKVHRGNDKDDDPDICKEPETTVLYPTAQDVYGKPNTSRSKDIQNSNDVKTKNTSQNKFADQNCTYCKDKEMRKLHDKLDPIQECEQKLHSRKNLTNFESLSNIRSKEKLRTRKKPRIYNAYLDIRRTELHGKKKKRRRRKDFEVVNDKLIREYNLPFTEEKDRHNKYKTHRNKYVRTELDREFIAEIIKRQYKPITLFGTKDSDFSQFSAPMCRDQECVMRETNHKDSELCACYHNEQRHHKQEYSRCGNYLSDTKSICDSRLCSYRKHKKCTKRFEDYNNSTMYDIVPVKEKTSPKSRRKFVEENMLVYDKYNEVLPSPRTQRPRLNLRAQNHTVDNDDIYLESIQNRSKRQSPISNDGSDSNVSSEVFVRNINRERLQHMKISKTSKPYNQGEDIVNCMQSPILSNEQTVMNNDTTLNTQTDISADKTDKTLSEIKEILQNFLLEMKKESSRTDKLNNSPLSDGLKVTETQQQTSNRNLIFNSDQSFNKNNNFVHYMPPYMSPCCYPILPVCAMNCRPSGLADPNPSCTCAANEEKSKEQTLATNVSLNKIDCSVNTETQKLIKEIHKLITQSPNASQKQSFNNNNSTLVKPEMNHANAMLTSRSAGGSSKASKHDAKVGTRKSGHSKSCEAIISQMGMSKPRAQNIWHSDTILERGSGEEATTAQSSSESDGSSDSTVVHKKRENTFARVLKSIGLFKNSKKEIVEKPSKNDNNIKVRKPNPIPPFQQHIMTYNMHGQEYFHLPPVPKYSHHPAQYQCECYGHIHCNPRPSLHDSPTYGDTTFNKSRSKHPAKHMRQYCNPSLHIPMPPGVNCYDHHYANMSPQVPLCLKEIEVKSIGTQSVRKMSILERFTNKIKIRAQKTKETTQSASQSSKDKPVTNMFHWKKLQAKSVQYPSDPMIFSYKTQKRLAEGDDKIRNAMLKKMIKKRNPFSPKKLLVKSVIGKNKSNFGEPPKIYRTKMFF